MIINLDALFVQKFIITALKQEVRDFQAPALPSTKTKMNGLYALQAKLRTLYLEHFPFLTQANPIYDLRFSAYPNLRRTVSLVLAIESVDDTTLDNVLVELERMPEDWVAEQFHQEFDALNGRFQYFKQHIPASQSLFEELATVCRTAMVLFEKNYDLTDDRVYLCAYHMMALLISDSTQISYAKKIYKKVNHFLANAKKTNEPIGEAFLTLTLPIATALNDRAGWMALIKDTQQKAFPFFTQATQIEEKLSGKAPKNISEARTAAALIKYIQGHRDPELAALCYSTESRTNDLDKRGMEAVFDQCLDYIHTSQPTWPKKTHDALPNLIIRGTGVVRDYCVAKLPVNDKRGLVLGKWTDCCQSIGGIADQHVKYALSAEDHGLYVILKHKRGEFMPIHDEGSLNYTNFQIIGTSYAWLSTSDDLCLDSLECLRDSISNTQLQQLVSEFAEAVLERHPSIQRVNVGTGGRTPNELLPRTGDALTMKSGEACRDSARQYVAGQSLKLMFIEDAALLGLWETYCTENNTSKDLIAFLRTLSADLRERALAATDSNGRTLLGAAVVGIIACDVADILSLYPDDDACFAALKMTEGYGEMIFHLAARRPEVLLAILSPMRAYTPEKVQDLLQLKDRKGQTILHLSARQPIVVSALLALMHGEDVLVEFLQTRNAAGQTVFHLAAKIPEALSALLAVCPQEKLLEILEYREEHHQRTVFHLAAEAPQALIILLNVTNACCSQEEFLNVLQMQDEHHQHVFHHAATHPDSLLALLDVYPRDKFLENLSDEDYFSCTVLHLAVAHPRALSVLLAAVDTWPKEKFLEILNMRNFMENTVLHNAASRPDSLVALLACIYGDSSEKMREMLIMQGQGGNTVLHLAVSHPDVISVLLAVIQARASVQLPDLLRMQNGHGSTVFHLAARNHSASFSMLLRAMEAYPREQLLDILQLQSRGGKTVLHLVAKKPILLAKILELYPSDKRSKILHVRDDELKSILHYVVDHQDSLSIILAAYPDEGSRFAALKMQDQQGHRALNLAASHPHSRSLLDILAAYPDDAARLVALEMEDSDGTTILHQTAGNYTLFSEILSRFTEPARRQRASELLHKYRSTLLLSAACNPSALSLLLASYPSDALRLETVQMMYSDGMTLLEHAAKKFEALLAILAAFSDPVLLTEVLKMPCNWVRDPVLSVVGKTPELLSQFLAAFNNDNARLTAMQMTNKHGTTVLMSYAHTPALLSVILASVSDDVMRIKMLRITNQSTGFFLPVIFYTAKNPKSLSVILAAFSSDEGRKAVLEIQKKYGETIMSQIKNTPELLSVILSSFNDYSVGLEYLRAAGVKDSVHSTFG